MMISTGHLAMSQTTTAVCPRPMALPTLSAIGPVNTTITALIMIRMTMAMVTARRTGIVFHTGRPSPTS